MENQNSVAFVGKIDQINEIPNCDNIEQLIVNGWSCISKKDIYQAGNLVGIATVDAIIPEKMVEKLGVKNYLRKGTRVRTIKLKGVYSECLLFDVDSNYKEGQDLMGDFGIIKYEEPVKQIQLASGKKIKYHQNPNFHVYYKFPNMKNVKGMFNELDVVQVTRKIHGTNARYGFVKKDKLSIWDRIKKLYSKDVWIGYEYIIGSHHVEKGSDSQGFYDFDVWRTIGEKYMIQKSLETFVKEYLSPELVGSGIVLYGEIYGPGIQKNYDYCLKELEVVFFDVTLNGKYQHVDIVEDICDKLGYNTVEELFNGVYHEDVVQQLVIRNIEGTKVPEEGIVVKVTNGDRSKVAKIINPEYLIYSERHEVTDFHWTA